ncbi:unnamed protein product [Clavelina lepadiformis]|uniref:BTB domain-containing protein n=1 Tax=Clavelina lepadiformis TaxID=159417 RepID=A0ABP0G5S6_CLALP
MIFCFMYFLGNDIIQANKTILAASSDYFAQCLNDTSTFLEIPETSTSVFEILLDFIYTSHIRITSENVEALLKAAVTFELPKLQHLCKVRDLCTQIESHIFMLMLTEPC